jgi:hypothetical protein
MIFAQYSYKKKFYALLVVAVLLAGTAYKRSFSTLFKSVGEYSALSAKAKEIDAKKGNIALLERELAGLDMIIGRKNADREKVQQEIISFVTTSKPAVDIFDLRPVHEFSSDRYHIYSYQVDLTGNFNSLIKLAYSFEKEFSYSKVVGLRFYNVKKSNNPDVLHLKITFQNYESI